MNTPTYAFTPLERQYLRLYAAAARRDFAVLQTASQLMNRGELGLVCPVLATQTATELQHMQADFDSELSALQRKHQLRRRSTPSPTPTPEDIARLIAASFFKLFTVLKTGDADPGVHKDGGWFSGTLDDWQRNAAALKLAFAETPEDAAENYMTPVVSAIAQLFNLLFQKKLPYLGLSAVDAPPPADEDWAGYDPDDEDDDSAPEYFD